MSVIYIESWWLSSLMCVPYRSWGYSGVFNYSHICSALQKHPSIHNTSVKHEHEVCWTWRHVLSSSVNKGTFRRDQPESVALWSNDWLLMLKSVNSILQHHKVSEETRIMEKLIKYRDSILETIATKDFFERPGWKDEHRQAMWRKLGALEGPLDQEGFEVFWD